LKDRINNLNFLFEDIKNENMASCPAMKIAKPEHTLSTEGGVAIRCWERDVRHVTHVVVDNSTTFSSAFISWVVKKIRLFFGLLQGSSSIASLHPLSANLFQIVLISGVRKLSLLALLVIEICQKYFFRLQILKIKINSSNCFGPSKLFYYFP